MADVKVREKHQKSVKMLDKTAAWTERIKDPIVYSYNRLEDSSDGDISDYGEDKVKYLSNRIKDEIVYSSKKSSSRVVDSIKSEFQKQNRVKDKGSRLVSIRKKIKSSEKVMKQSDVLTKETRGVSKTLFAQEKKLAIESYKRTVRSNKKIIKATISSIKGIITAIKSLIGVITIGGSLASIIILIICLIGLLVTSIFGIFFSSENTGKNNIKMSDCIVELNEEMDNQIKQIELTNIYDEVKINSNKAEWREILSIYTARVSNGDNKQNVIIIDEEKKNILKEIFWDINYITHEVKIGKNETSTIENQHENGFSNNNQFENLTLPGNEPKRENSKVLYININSKSSDEMRALYGFNDSQNKQYMELTKDDYSTLWSSVIYGTYESSGEITEWKQKGKEWSNIKIGTTNATIGDIGCLVTSISILIKKSDVSTKNIYPFNPGTFVTALNNNYGFDSRGNLQYDAISKVVPSFSYQGKVYLKGKSRLDKLNEIKRYYEAGYYLAVEVRGATLGNQHWVAVDNVTNNTVLMLDPGSNETDMWSKYNWTDTTQFVYFRG